MTMTEAEYQEFKKRFLSEISSLIDLKCRRLVDLDFNLDFPTILKKFLNECCRFDPLEKISTKDLYYKYKSWASTNGYNIESHQLFSKRVATVDSRINKKLTSDGTIWQGINKI